MLAEEHLSEYMEKEKVSEDQYNMLMKNSKSRPKNTPKMKKNII